MKLINGEKYINNYKYMYKKYKIKKIIKYKNYLYKLKILLKKIINLNLISKFINKIHPFGKKNIINRIKNIYNYKNNTNSVKKINYNMKVSY
jgi:hypothetical protein